MSSLGSGAGTSAIPEQGTFDALETYWSKADFKSRNIQFIKDPKESSICMIWNALVTKTQITPKYYVHDLVEKMKTDKKDYESSIQQYSLDVQGVALALDVIAKRELELGANPDKKSPEEGLKLIPDQMRHLNNLLQNLKAHDEFIQEFNQLCPEKYEAYKCKFTHQETIESVQKGIRNLTELDKSLRAEIAERERKETEAKTNKEIDAIKLVIDNLSQKIEKGERIDEDYIVKEYPAIRDQIARLNADKSIIYDLLGSYHVLLNKSYIQSFESRLKGSEIGLFSKPIIMTLQKLGYPGITFAEFEVKARKEFIGEIGDILKAKQNQDVLVQPPANLITIIQNMQMDKIGEVLGLKESQRNNLTAVFKVVMGLERKWDKIKQGQDKSIKDHIIDSLEISRPDQKKKVVGKIEAFKTNIPLSRFLETVFDWEYQTQQGVPLPFSKDVFKMSSEHLSEFTNSLNALVEKATEGWLNDTISTQLIDYVNLLNECDYTITQLATNIEYGQAVDNEFVRSSYKGFNKMIQRLEIVDPKEANELRQRYYKTINAGYLETMVNQLENGKLEPLSIQIQFTLKRFGFTLDEAALDSSRKSLLSRLKSHLEKGDVYKLIEENPLAVIDNINKMQIEIAAGLSGLPVEPRKNLIAFLEKVNNYISQIQKRNADEIDKIKKEVIERLEKEIADPARRAVVQDRIKNYKPGIPRTTILLDLFHKKNQLKSIGEVFLPEVSKETQSLLYFSKDEFEGILAKMTAHIDKSRGELEWDSYRSANKSKIQDLIKQKTEDKEEIEIKKQNDWFNRNRLSRSFDYNQGEWGDQEILGGGCCASITFGWILQIQRNPTKKITSIHDVNPDLPKKVRHIYASSSKKIQEKLSAELQARGFVSERETKEAQDVYVTPKERRIQAEYFVTPRGTEGVSGMPMSVLKREGATKETLVGIENAHAKVTSLIDQVIDLDEKSDRTLLRKSAGMVQVSMNNTEAGHSVGMQIDRQGGVYRFMDPNFGIYTYDSLDRMRKEFGEFLEVFYPDWGYYRAIQYVLKKTESFV